MSMTMKDKPFVENKRLKIRTVKLQFKAFKKEAKKEPVKVPKKEPVIRIRCADWKGKSWINWAPLPMDKKKGIHPRDPSLQDYNKE